MANFNFNKVILGGRITATPELKKTPSGVSVVQFTVAVNRKYSGSPRTSPPTTDGMEASAEKAQSIPATTQQADFIRVTAWRQQAEFVYRYFGKGASICIVGSIQTRNWNDQQGNKRYTTEVIADEINFVDSKSDGVGSAPPLPSDADAPPDRGSGAASPKMADNVGADVPGGPVPQFETITGDDELPF